MRTSVQKFKSATRIITAIGKDLIKDEIAAIIELVKNSYDADANNVWISFEFKDDSLITIIKDDGTGMTEDDIINKWLVPATDNKLNTNYTKKYKRALLGQKGLGRYSALILGNYMTISSVSNYSHVNFEIDWDEIKKYKFLDEVSINLNVEESVEKNGTIISISNKDNIYLFDNEKFKELRRQLQLLISPLYNQENNFSIYIKNSSTLTLWETEYEKVEPFSILDLYHYRFYGEINSKNEIFDLNFDNATQNEKITFKPSLHNEFIHQIKKLNFIESYKFDFRVYDRDSPGISSLLEKTNYTKANEMKYLLDQISGVKIYRNNFRIGTYGDNSHDWLDLNMDRVQNPSLKVSANQILGTIQINSQNESNLVEKSARDGLQDNQTFINFKALTKFLINILERERFVIRRNLAKQKNRTTVHDEIGTISNYVSVTEKVTKALENAGLRQDQITIILEPLKEKEKADILSLNEIEKQITIYEKQITLGKLVEILMHEGKKSIQGLKTYPKLALTDLEKIKELAENNSEIGETTEKLSKKLEGISSYSIILGELFRKINPLARVRKKNQKTFLISEAFDHALQIYSKKISTQNILVENKLGEIEWFGWREDFIVAFANLIDNSIYWMNSSKDKKISIEAFSDSKKIWIEYKNSGQEIPLNLIKDEVIFEPGISYKQKGTGSGIGLPISGEALKRNDFILKCQYMTGGALFILESKRIGGLN